MKTLTVTLFGANAATIKSHLSTFVHGKDQQGNGLDLLIGTVELSLNCFSPDQLETIASHLLSAAQEIRDGGKPSDIPCGVVEATPADGEKMVNAEGMEGTMDYIFGVPYVICKDGRDTKYHSYRADVWKPA